MSLINGKYGSMEYSILIYERRFGTGCGEGSLYQNSG